MISRPKSEHLKNLAKDSDSHLCSPVCRIILDTKTQVTPRGLYIDKHPNYQGKYACLKLLEGTCSSCKGVTWNAKSNLNI